MSLEVITHANSKRIRQINIKEEDLDKLIFPFNKRNITSLEYKPFTRFTLAKSVDDIFSGKLSKTLFETLKDRNTGAVFFRPDIKNSKFD